MLKTLSDEVAADGITVNCLAPGLIQTARTDELMESRRKMSGQSKEEYMVEYVASIPAKRLGDADEFGAVAAFSPRSKRNMRPAKLFASMAENGAQFIKSRPRSVAVV